MPLTSKGKKIRRALRKRYGKKRGDSVFYASINSGKVKGAEGRRRKRNKKKRTRGRKKKG